MKPLSALPSAALFVALAGLAVCAAAQPTTPPPLVSPGTWVVMGSSTASGEGAQRGWGWGARIATLAGLVGASVVNLARGSATSYAGLSTSAPSAVPKRPAPDTDVNIDTALIFDPKLVILSYPSNDTFEGFAPEEAVANLLSIRQTAQARRIAVMVLSSQPRRSLTPEQTAQQLQIDKALQEAVGPCFVDVRTPLLTPEGAMNLRLFERDGIHPNSTGHALVYVAVKQALESGRCVRLPAVATEPSASSPAPS